MNTTITISHFWKNYGCSSVSIGGTNRAMKFFLFTDHLEVTVYEHDNLGGYDKYLFPIHSAMATIGFALSHLNGGDELHDGLKLSCDSHEYTTYETVTKAETPTKEEVS